MVRFMYFHILLSKIGPRGDCLTMNIYVLALMYVIALILLVSDNFSRCCRYRVVALVVSYLFYLSIYLFIHLFILF